MKKAVILSLISLIALTSADAGVKQRVVRRRAVKNVMARRVIRRTAVVILVAHKKVKENKVYTGNLARSIAHQKHAKRLFAKRMFNPAVYHSLRARRLALLAIKANKGEEPKESAPDKEEGAVAAEAPGDDELDKELKEALPDESEKDEDAIASTPDVDEK